MRTGLRFLRGEHCAGRPQVRPEGERGEGGDAFHQQGDGEGDAGEAVREPGEAGHSAGSALGLIFTTLKLTYLLIL